MDLYQQELMDHYRHPRNRGEIPNADFASSALNPSCGDMIAYQGTVKDGVIQTIGFTGKGCVISQATASMLSEHVKGKSLPDIMAMDKATIRNLIGIELGPTRLRCALLSLEALQQAITEYIQEKT